MAKKTFNNDFLRIGGYVQTNKIIAQELGHREATVLGHYLAKQKKWAEEGKLKRGGKIYVKHEDIEAELGLSAHEHRTAVANLEAEHLIKRFDPNPKEFNRVYIRIRRVRIERFINAHLPEKEEKFVKNFNEVDKSSSKNLTSLRKKIKRPLVKNVNEPSSKNLTT
jgi:DNA-binding Lrp family transcriptional regulator